MRSFAVLAAVAGLASANNWSQGWGSAVYVTDVVTAYTTYCPSATKISHNGVTYTVTEATTLTISNCPCTVTRPAYSTGAPAPSSPAVSSYVPVAPKPSASASVPVAPKPSASASSPSSPVYTGAASKAQVAGGLVAALGLVAAAL